MYVYFMRVEYLVSILGVSITVRIKLLSQTLEVKRFMLIYECHMERYIVFNTLLDYVVGGPLC